MVSNRERKPFPGTVWLLALVSHSCEIRARYRRVEKFMGVGEGGHLDTFIIRLMRSRNENRVQDVITERDIFSDSIRRRLILRNL